MLQKVKSRLTNLQIPFDATPSSIDENLITFAIQKVEFHITSRTNLKAIPEELTNVAIDMAVGEFLFTKHSNGQLDLSHIDFEAVVKQVQDGDTNVTYAVSDSYSPEALFNNFIVVLRHGEVKWSDYRVVKW